MNKDGKLMDKLLGFAAKVQSNIYLDAISKGLMGTLPILMIGSIALLLAVIPIDAWKQFLTDAGIRTYLMAASTVTTSCMSLYACFLIGNRLASNFEVDGISAGIISIFAFLIITPLNEGALNMTWMGAQGLFAAMLATLVATRVYCALMKNDKIQIKMPDSVPPVIANTFEGLIPGMFVGALFIIIAVLFSFTPWGSLTNMIYTLVATPLQSMGSSIWAYSFIILVQMVLFFFGIHGALVVQPIINAVYLPMDTVNMEMVLAGAANADLNILGKTFYSIFTGIGGAGGTLSLVILILLISKSKQHKAIGRLSAVPSLFTINEPVMFGLPCVLNPLLAIPFIITPIVQSVIAYIAIAIGLVPHLNGVQVPFGTPILVNAFLAGGWRASVLQIVLVAVGILIYLPFFKVLDNQVTKTENKTKESQD